MKKFLVIASCLLIALTACTKPEKQESKLPTPTKKEYHASITLSGSKFDRPLKNGDVPKTIELSSGGKFLLGFYDTDAVKPETSPLVYKSGKYTVATAKAIGAGMQFIFPMYGTLTVKGASGNDMEVEYTTQGGESYDGDAVLTNDEVSGALADEICRSWKPTDIIVSASGGNLENAIVGKKFSADIHEIIDYLKSKGMNINAEAFEKYALESFDFTESGLMFINFKDFAIAPFVGNFSLNESQDDNLAYDFSLSWEDQPVIPVKGDGSVTVNGDQLILFTESDVTVQSATYHITITILCSEIK